MSEQCQHSYDDRSGCVECHKEALAAVRARCSRLEEVLRAARERLAPVAFTEWETPLNQVKDLAIRIWRPKARKVVAQIDAALVSTGATLPADVSMKTQNVDVSTSGRGEAESCKACGAIRRAPTAAEGDG